MSERETGEWCRANGHGARATPGNDSRGRHDRFPLPSLPPQGGRGTRSADGATFTVTAVSGSLPRAGSSRIQDSFILLLIAAVLSMLFTAGCSSTGPAPVDSRDGYGPAPAGFYRVRSGDTLSTIAVRRGLDYGDLARWNRLSPPYRIYAGKLLRVEPPAKKQRRSKGAAPDTQIAQERKKSDTSVAKASRTPSRSQVDGDSAAKSGLSWRWPAKGEVVQTFRSGDRTRQGIRIAGRAGQAVAAAESGTVVYSGSGLKGYGNLIIVKHNKNYLSAYGFNRRLLVSEGQRVKRGQNVAEMGQLAAGGYLLHFEIRKNGTAVDPLRYLPRAR
jgi:lipoprotein NlpD